jgi:predicted nucleic acid-binding protein
VGLILDSSVAIAAERRGDTVQAFLQRVIDAASNQEAALSTVGVVELVHGIHRANTAERRARREAFVEDLLAAVAVYPLTTDIARLAGKLDAEQRRGVVIPFADLLIGTTALSLWYSVLTTNPRHFGRIAGLVSFNSERAGVLSVRLDQFSLVTLSGRRAVVHRDARHAARGATCGVELSSFALKPIVPHRHCPPNAAAGA